MKFTIKKDHRGWGVWLIEPKWEQTNAIEYFATKKQAKEFNCCDKYLTGDCPNEICPICGLEVPF